MTATIYAGQQEKVAAAFEDIGIPHGVENVPVLATHVRIEHSPPERPGQPACVTAWFCETPDTWKPNVEASQFDRFHQRLAVLTDGQRLPDPEAVEVRFACALPPKDGYYGVVGRMSANGSRQFTVDGFFNSNELPPLGKVEEIRELQSA